MRLYSVTAAVLASGLLRRAVQPVARPATRACPALSTDGVYGR